MDVRLLSQSCSFSCCEIFHCSVSSHPSLRCAFPAAAAASISLMNTGANLKASHVPATERNLKCWGNFSSRNWDSGLEMDRFTCTASENAGGGEVDIGGPAMDENLTESIDGGIKDVALLTGSPIVLVEAPALLKTAEPMPMMRPNRGLLKPGDAGRIIDRRPKNMWAVRFAVGSYLIDRKCFEPMDIT